MPAALVKPGIFPTSYKDGAYSQADDATSQRLGLPAGLLQSIRMDGEKTNADQVSSASAKTPYQITPATRDGILKQYGIDAYLSPETASEAAGLILRDSLKRNGSDVETAVREYHGGTDPANWGKINDAYWKRVSSGIESRSMKALSQQFGEWLAANPAQPAPPAPQPTGDQAMSQAFGAWLKGQGAIPGTPTPDRQPPPLGLPVQRQPEQPGLVDKAIGAGEAGLTALTGATSGAAGMAGGLAAGLAQRAASGDLLNPDAPDLPAQYAHAASQALTYAPRTEVGQDYAQSVGDAMQQLTPVAAVLPGMAPLVTAATGTPALLRGGIEGVARDMAPGALGDAAAAAAGGVVDAARAGAQRIAGLAKGVTTLPRRAVAAAMGDSPAAAGTKPSVGAAGTDMSAQRTATAEGLPVPLRLTKGEATRDPAQLKFEIEASKNPDLGLPLRERILENNDRLLSNFDAAIDQTGAQAPTLRATGAIVDDALRSQYEADKARVRSAYAAAQKAGEMESPATLDGLVRHLNDSAPDAATAPLLDVARARALRLGVAADDGAGNLVAQPVPLKIAETYRQAIGRATDYEPTNIRQATIIKGLVDEATDGLGGNGYKQARAMRARMAQNYEDHAVISKLLNNKRGTADRQVALEDVFDHSILKGSTDDVRQVRRVLQRAGEDGAQAWRELQGSTAGWLRDQATTTATDATGARVVSPAKLDRAIRVLDADGKLDFVFGRKGAQTMRDLRDVAQYVRTAPPEAAVNYSNTASALLAGFGDIAGYGVSGIPAPIATLGRMGLKYIKDQRLKNRIEAALQDVGRQQTQTQRQILH